MRRTGVSLFVATVSFQGFPAPLEPTFVPADFSLTHRANSKFLNAKSCCSKNKTPVNSAKLIKSLCTAVDWGDVFEDFAFVIEVLPIVHEHLLWVSEKVSLYYQVPKIPPLT